MVQYVKKERVSYFNFQPIWASESRREKTRGRSYGNPRKEIVGLAGAMEKKKEKGKEKS